MQSWLGACVIVGCAIGATGIVIHHYAKQPCPEQEVIYMISYDEWGKGIIKEFNRAISLTTNLYAPDWDNDHWKADEQTNKKETRHKCVNDFADLYSKKYQDEDRDKSQTLSIANEDLKVVEEKNCLILKEPTVPV